MNLNPHDPIHFLVGRMMDAEQMRKIHAQLDDEKNQEIRRENYEMRQALLKLDPKWKSSPRPKPRRDPPPF